MASTFIDTIDQLKTFLDRLKALQGSIPQLFIDLEGHNISSGGALSLLQLLVVEERRVYLIDLFVLGEDALSTPGSSGITLRSILESSTQAKAFFDVRTDSYALYRHYQIRLAGVQDIQLMALAAGRQAQRYVNGLAKCIEHDLYFSPDQKRSWLSTKDAGKKLFDPQFGGSYAIFDERPLPDAVRMYCSQDVLLLPALGLKYYQKLSRAWFDRVLDETRNRVNESQKPTFRGGRHIAIGPTRWMSIRRESFPPLSEAASQDFITNCQELMDQLQDTSLETARKNVNTVAPSRPTTLENLLAELKVADDQFSETSQQLLEFDESDWEESDKDFTACSADDCGYCGHCDY